VPRACTGVCIPHQTCYSAGGTEFGIGDEDEHTYETHRSTLAKEATRAIVAGIPGARESGRSNRPRDRGNRVRDERVSRPGIVHLYTLDSRYVQLSA